jgi:hypothetical protein
MIVFRTGFRGTLLRTNRRHEDVANQQREKGIIFPNHRACGYYHLPMRKTAPVEMLLLLRNQHPDCVAPVETHLM